MIYTSNYKNCKDKDIKMYSISWDKGKDADYYGDYYLDLAPHLDFFRKWKENRDKIDFIENTTYYIREYYNKVLKQLDPNEEYDKLDNSTLLCYEDSSDFCHRHIVASWFEKMLGVEVLEIKFDDNNNIIIEQRPKYIEEILEKVIAEKRI